ncbi:MAG TPA: alpha/beta hydrolase [Enhygromyxa sp.]|nr:alpha/beta hydrolase [Enhygromyxa sp.]
MVALGGCDRQESEPPIEPPALHETAPIDLASLCSSEATRAWAVLDASGSIVAVTRGRCLGRVEDPEQGPLWHLVAQLQGRDETRPSWELHTWLDTSGQPRHAEFRTPELVTRFAWAEGKLFVRRLGDQLALEQASAAWVIPNHALYVREVMLRLGVIRQVGWVPEQDRIATLELTLTQLDGDRAQASAGTSVLALEGAAEGLAGLQIGPVMAGDALIYRPLAHEELAEFLPAVPKPRYVASEDLRLEPIEIPGTSSGAPKLAGELVIAASASAERKPAVLFLGGAGPQDRHGIVPHSGVDIGSHELHDALARAGFVVLRFDDRGVGASEIGDEATPGFLELVDDGRRALNFLASRPEIDPSEILVIGHGEGALQASILAAERVRAGKRKHPIAGLVLLAGPGRNLRELVYDEIRASMLGRSDGEIRTIVTRAQQVHDAALAGEDLPASSEGARRWMVEAFAEDPLARLAKVRGPILALQGGKDFQVSPERDFGPIQAYIERKAAKGSAAELFAELDHLFKPELGVSTPGHYADLRRRVDPAFIERVVTWSLEICAR